jgi:hypothetical protein
MVMFAVSRFLRRWMGWAAKVMPRSSMESTNLVDQCGTTLQAVQTVEAWKHGVHRQFGDVVLFAVIGGILLALLLPRREQAAVVPQ